MEPEDKTNAWLRIVQAVQKKVDENSFETWFEPTSFIGEEGDALYIKVPNSYFRDWLSFHYSALINECAQELLGKPFDIKYIFDETPSSFIRRSPDERKTKQGLLLNPNLNPNYTFDNFVVGSCNQFAQAAATAVAKNPGKSYNPLYVYGGAGLGKTHLMNAIGHFTLMNNHRMKVLYITTEKFMNELINHLQYGKILDFREKYRSVDILSSTTSTTSADGSGRRKSSFTPSTISTTARSRSSSRAIAPQRRSPILKRGSGPGSNGG